MAEYYNFDDVLSQLKIDDEELKRMVSEGEITAYRDANKVRFKKQDIDTIRSGKTGEPVERPTVAGGPKFVLDDDLIKEYGHIESEAAEASRPEDVTELSSPDDAVQLEEAAPQENVAGIEDFQFSEQTGQVATFEEGEESEPFVLEETEDISIGTEPGSTEIAETGATIPFDLNDTAAPLSDTTMAGAETQGTALTEEFTQPITRSTRKRRTPKYMLSPEEERLIERKKPSFIWAAFMFLVFVATVYTSIVVFEKLRLDTGKVSQPTNLTAGFADWILEKYWQNQEWIKGHERNVPVVPTEDKAKPYHRDVTGIQYHKADPTNAKDPAPTTDK